MFVIILEAFFSIARLIPPQWRIMRPHTIGGEGRCWTQKKPPADFSTGGHDRLVLRCCYRATTFFFLPGRDTGWIFLILLGTSVFEKKAEQRCRFSNGQSIMFQHGV